MKTKFVSMMGFREVLRFKFSQPDLYFVCLMEALSDKIDIQMPDEVAKCEWKHFVRISILKELV